MTIAALAFCGALQNAGDADGHKAFAFLTGVWELQERIDLTRGTKETGQDWYEFRQPIGSGAIEACWRFNRGTESAPDWANAIYISAPRNTGLGEKTGAVSDFYFDERFDYNGRQAVQRQWWEPAGENRLNRHFKNSYDGGET